MTKKPLGKTPIRKIKKKIKILGFFNNKNLEKINFMVSRVAASQWGMKSLPFCRCCNYIDSFWNFKQIDSLQRKVILGTIQRRL